MCRKDGRVHRQNHREDVSRLAWPGLGQVLRIERVWWERGARHEAVRSAITSLPAAVADARRLLALVRGHWAIENALHYVKNVTLDEDRSSL